MQQITIQIDDIPEFKSQVIQYLTSLISEGTLTQEGKEIVKESMTNAIQSQVDQKLSTPASQQAIKRAVDSINYDSIQNATLDYTNKEVGNRIKELIPDILSMLFGGEEIKIVEKIVEIPIPCDLPHGSEVGLRYCGEYMWGILCHPGDVFTNQSQAPGKYFEYIGESVRTQSGQPAQWGITDFKEIQGRLVGYRFIKD